MEKIFEYIKRFTTSYNRKLDAILPLKRFQKMDNIVLPDSQSTKYTGNHIHPYNYYDIEFVAYETFDNKWDVFIFSDEFISKDFEKHRIDQYHIYYKTIYNVNDLDKICNEIIIKIGDDYKVIPYYKEMNSRIICGKLYDYLKSIGSQRMYLYQEGDYWIISIRKKDFINAKNIINNNI
jgi:hypothetical protein